ncbi:MAG: hypothetical protein ACLFQ5_01570 [Oceanicaulis sp.]
MKKAMWAPALLTAGLVLAACQTNQSTAESGSMSNTAEARSGDLVCRTQQVTGSRMGQRVCMTSDQWNDVAESGRESTRELQRSPAAGPDNQGGAYCNPVDSGC